MDNKAIPVYTKYQDIKDSVSVWPKDKDGFKDIRIRAIAEGAVLDTVLKGVKPQPEKSPVLKREFVSSADNYNAFGAFFAIKTSRPIQSFYPSRMKVQTIKDANSVKARYGYLDSAHTLLGVYFEPKEDSSYKFTMFASAITDVSGATNKDTAGTLISVPSSRQNGSFSTEVSAPGEGVYIFQMVNDKGVVFYESTFSRGTSVRVPFVVPGSYQLRLINDRNRNGRWDGGNFFTKELPEEVIYYKDVITIKPNWEVDGIKFDADKGIREF
jgi:hypothetical protein